MTAVQASPLLVNHARNRARGNPCPNVCTQCATEAMTARAAYEEDRARIARTIDFIRSFDPFRPRRYRKKLGRKKGRDSSHKPRLPAEYVEMLTHGELPPADRRNFRLTKLQRRRWDELTYC